MSADVNLSAHALTKRYESASSCEAVRGASLDLKAGDFVSLVGRSGSGKSTLLAMLGALTKPTSGTLLLNGADVWALSEEKRSIFRSREVGFIFQFHSLLPNLTAFDNIAFPAFLGNQADTKAIYARAAELLIRVGLGDRADAYPGSLSGGEQRRVVIARAMINSPSLVLADEPTSDLDEDTEADIIDLLEDLQASEAFSFVLVTHNLHLAKHAQRCYEMKRGMLVPSELSRVVAEGEPRVRYSAWPRSMLGRNFLCWSLRVSQFSLAQVFGAMCGRLQLAWPQYWPAFCCSTLESPNIRKRKFANGGRGSLKWRIWRFLNCRPVSKPWPILERDGMNWKCIS
jgi:ABC-type lipoprotein export system ATPase subunit